MTVKKTSIMSSPRRRGSRNGLKEWIPALDACPDGHGNLHYVIPAEAGIQKWFKGMDSRLRGNDKEENGSDKRRKRK